MDPVAGLDMGATKILGVVRDGDDSIAAEWRVPTPQARDDVVEALVAVVDRLRARRPGLAAVGIGAPGPVDRDGVLRSWPHRPEIVGLGLRALESRTGIPIAVDNDATCAALAEHELGAARGHDDVLVVVLGTGIGGGLIGGGQVQRGAHGFAGEIGHIVVDADGPACICGRRGCWEVFASGSSLGRLGREAARAERETALVGLADGDVERIDGEHVVRAAAGGDRAATAVVGEYARRVAVGLVSLVSVLDPRLVVVGGGAVAGGDVVLEPIRTAFAELADPSGLRRPVPIVAARLGERAGAIGACLLAASAIGTTRS